MVDSSNLSQGIPYILLWIFTSSLMILFNKYLLTSLGFSFPIFLTTWHMFMSTLLTQFLCTFTNLIPGPKDNPLPTMTILKKITPIAGIYTLSLIFSNFAYLYISVAYIQMLKASMPIVVLFYTVLFKIDTTTPMEISIILLICLGVALTSIGELKFSMVGFLTQMAGISFEGLRLILINITLKKYNLDSLSLLYYLAPITLCFNLIAFFLYEYNSTFVLYIENHFFVSFSSFLSLFLLFLLNALVAFSLNFTSNLLISKTSALVLTLSGIVKDILIVAFSVIFFKSPITLLQMLGYAVSLISLNLHKDYKKLNIKNLYDTSIGSKEVSLPTTSTTSSTSSTSSISLRNFNHYEDNELDKNELEMTETSNLLAKK